MFRVGVRRRFSELKACYASTGKISGKIMHTCNPSSREGRGEMRRSLEFSLWALGLERTMSQNIKGKAIEEDTHRRLLPCTYMCILTYMCVNTHTHTIYMTFAPCRSLVLRGEVHCSYLWLCMTVARLKVASYGLPRLCFVFADVLCSREEVPFYCKFAEIFFFVMKAGWICHMFSAFI